MATSFTSCRRPRTSASLRWWGQRDPIQAAWELPVASASPAQSVIECDPVETNYQTRSQRHDSAEGITYLGVLYAGLIQQPMAWVIEFNSRFRWRRPELSCRAWRLILHWNITDILDRRSHYRLALFGWGEALGVIVASEDIRWTIERACLLPERRRVATLSPPTIFGG